MTPAGSSTAPIVDGTRRRVINRHGVVVRLTHWLNAACLFFLLLSGLQIFNAHPALYWGDQSDWDHPLLAIGAYQTKAGEVVGLTSVFDHVLDTTGFLGVSKDRFGDPDFLAFPHWLIIPGYQDLTTGRLWHFFFAWLFAINLSIYLGTSLINGHLRRDLLPAPAEFRLIPRTMLQHLLLRFPRGPRPSATISSRS